MKINLPKFDIKIRRTVEGKLQVYDPLRAKFVALTPEEWVRQHFVNFLVQYKGYPVLYMANEVGLKQNGVQRRCDTVIYNRNTVPVAIVEYKASTIDITAKVFDQIVRYNMVMGVKWLMVSNGMKHYCCRVNQADGTYSFLRNIPPYEVMTDQDVQ